ncbi:hypothetical protein BDC45DRAFT_609102 [Circinella umbellata]|nr:hypothetical protein BDC45DRAFT_609102 [Circinella umbellata]
MSQIHLRKPSHIALNGSMSFSTRQCEKMGVSIHFAGLTVNKWSSVEDLALIIAQGTTPNRRVKPAIAHTHLLGLFQNISDHSQSTPALIIAKRLGNTLDKKINKKSRHGNNINDQDNTEDDGERDDNIQADDNTEANDAKTKDEEAPLDFTTKLLSITTEEANSLQQKKRNGGELTREEEKIMRCGLSHLVDMVNASDEGQRKLFERLLDSWEIIVNLCAIENGISKAQKYLIKMKLSESLSRFEGKILDVFDLVLNLLENHPNLFIPSKENKYTETDYLARLWTPLFDLLLSAGNNLVLTRGRVSLVVKSVKNQSKEKVRLKTGDSVSKQATISKRLCYNSTEHTIAFKIDLRFVVDFKDNEYDVAAGELAKTLPNDVKLFGDECKLVHEGKDIVDGLIIVYNGESAGNETIGWILQLTGPDGEISSVHLIKPFLYIAIPEQKIDIPKNIQSMKNFPTTLSYLLMFTRKIQESGYNIISSLQTLEDNRSSIAERFGRPSSIIPPCTKTGWTCPTYYSPPPNTDEPIMDDTRQCPSQLVSNRDNEKCIDEQQYDGAPDEFGWVKIKGQSKWYNVLIKIVSGDPYA